MSLILVQLSKPNGTVTPEEVEGFEQKLLDYQARDAEREDGLPTYVVTNLHVNVNNWAFRHGQGDDTSSSSEDWEEEHGTSTTSISIPDDEENCEEHPETSSSSTEMEEYDIAEPMDIE
jgi:hypothetical protein